ncbi:MAG: hypothetical protein AAFU85_23960 [Planctomycetota bacterium]
MTRRLLVLIGSALLLLPDAANAEEPTPKKSAEPKHNQVYVKIIMPIEPVVRDQDRRVVESWIADDLKKRGQAKFTGVTEWVPLGLLPLESTHVWNGGKLGDQYFCPVGADIERPEGSVMEGSVMKVHVSGWSPGGAYVVIALRDEPGSRAIAAVKELKAKQGMPYVAVFIGPPSKESAVPIDRGRSLPLSGDRPKPCPF